MLKPIIFVLFNLALLLFITPGYSQDEGFTLKTVVIDPGHGGRDPGAVVGNVKEKDIVLEVALLTGKYINEKFDDVNVIYTRDKDVFVQLDKRAEIANKNDADLFISMHVNYFHSSSINGAETFVLGNHRSEENLKVAQMENSVILLEEDYSTRYEGFDPNSAESYIMFELIQNEFLEQSTFFADKLQKSFVSAAKRKNRGVKQAGFLVLRQTSMPSVLVELGFLSNSRDKVYMLSDEGKKRMANSVADAFANYKRRVDSRSSIPVKTTKLENSSDQNIELTKSKQNPSTIIPINEIVKDGEWYAIQIVASRELLEPDFKVFNDHYPVVFYNEDNWYKYCIKVTQDLNEAESVHEDLKTSDRDAILIKFINGQKDKVLKY
ncbi:MAG: N-acetylmuramoyl-L-alanine amidase [Prolixibacteraceae bacterium]|jgi:N-acetylmuramoyl-L-alanine amidase|nr:N-acetylmuramoyl-L-alanine amidase [Prolixibacteraceae bacterium]